jgi:hypothetical protein
MRARTLALALLAACAATPTAGSAPAGAIDPLQAFRTQLPRVEKATSVPVLLPDRLRLAGRTPRLYASSSAQRGGWLLALEGAPGCGGANACFVATFEGRRGKGLPARANVRLARGVRGYYHPIGCGASCSPASLWFVRGGVLYAWQIKDPPAPVRGSLVTMANEAIRAGAR